VYPIKLHYLSARPPMNSKNPQGSQLVPVKDNPMENLYPPVFPPKDLISIIGRLDCVSSMYPVIPLFNVANANAGNDAALNDELKTFAKGNWRLLKRLQVLIQSKRRFRPEKANACGMLFAWDFISQMTCLRT
jgi:hypothetical protein